MMMSQILQSVDFIKTQKCRYLKNKTLFLIKIKEFINCILRATLWVKNSFVVEVTFHVLSQLAPSLIKGVGGWGYDLPKIKSIGGGVKIFC